MIIAYQKFKKCDIISFVSKQKFGGFILKKIFILALIGVFGFVLLGCGRDTAPEGVSDEVFEIGSQGLDIVDQYLDNDLNRSDAVSQLDELIDDLIDIIDDLIDEDNIEVDDEDVEWALIVVTDAIDGGRSDSDEDEMMTRRDALAELLGRD